LKQQIWFGKVKGWWGSAALVGPALGLPIREQPYCPMGFQGELRVWSLVSCEIRMVGWEAQDSQGDAVPVDK